MSMLLEVILVISGGGIFVILGYILLSYLKETINNYIEYQRFKCENGAIKVKKRSFLYPRLFLGAWLVSIIALGFNLKTILILAALYCFTPLIGKAKNLIIGSIVFVLLLVGSFFGLKELARFADRFYKDKKKIKEVKK